MRYYKKRYEINWYKDGLYLNLYISIWIQSFEIMGPDNSEIFNQVLNHFKKLWYLFFFVASCIPIHFFWEGTSRLKFFEAVTSQIISWIYVLFDSCRWEIRHSKLTVLFFVVIFVAWGKEIQIRYTNEAQTGLSFDFPCVNVPNRQDNFFKPEHLQHLGLITRTLI